MFTRFDSLRGVSHPNTPSAACPSKGSDLAISEEPPGALFSFFQDFPIVEADGRDGKQVMRMR